MSLFKFEVPGVESGKRPSVKSNAGLDFSAKTDDNIFRHVTSISFHVSPSYITHKRCAISH